MIRSFSIYAIIQASDLSNIDFSQIGETSADTLRYNIAGTEFVIKWNSTPSFIADGTVVPISTLTHTECLAIMNTSAWSNLEPVE